MIAQLPRSQGRISKAVTGTCPHYTRENARKSKAMMTPFVYIRNMFFFKSTTSPLGSEIRCESQFSCPVCLRMYTFKYLPINLLKYIITEFPESVIVHPHVCRYLFFSICVYKENILGIPYPFFFYISGHFKHNNRHGHSSGFLEFGNLR